MSAFDYKLLQALDAVANYKSFDKAASALTITQSAVSQRIKLLEEQVATPLINRNQPIALTTMGENLRQHYRMVIELERELVKTLHLEATQSSTLSIALNADSLAIWFTQVIAPLITRYNIELDLIVDNEHRTLDRLRSGEAMAAISSKEKTIKGFTAEKLGDVNYLLVCTEAFQQRYFATGINIDTLQKAPAASFDKDDDMHFAYLNKHFNITERQYPCHFLPSSEAIVNLVKQGGAYALIPKNQIQQELNKRQLLDISEERILCEPLFFHRWILVRGQYKTVCNEIIKQAQIALK